ncbi:MAG: hypothetical protein ACYC6T_08150 [Thermoleophilia bacterium]
MTRDWRRLPYWQSTTSVERSLEELTGYLSRHDIDAVRTTRYRDPWRLQVEWEQQVGGVAVVVSFDVTVSDEELEEYTARQAGLVQNQAARLLWHTVKNLIAATEAGIIGLEDAVLPFVRTHANGKPTTVGALVRAQIRTAGDLGQTIVQRALPAKTGGGR